MIKELLVNYIILTSTTKTSCYIVFRIELNEEKDNIEKFNEVLDYIKENNDIPKDGKLIIQNIIDLKKIFE